MRELARLSLERVDLVEFPLTTAKLQFCMRENFTQIWVRRRS